MVFEQIIYMTLKPRIVLIDAEEHERFYPNHGSFLAWKLRVENYEQLHAEKPTVVAWSLLGVNSASRYVATQFLYRFVDKIPMIEVTNKWSSRRIPYTNQVPKELGLSLEYDVFWVPDDLPKFVKTLGGIPTGHGRPEEDDMRCVMISLHTFEKAFQWQIDESREDYLDVSETHLGDESVLRDFFRYFPQTRNLIVMVDVPRGPISCWDQIQVVGADDPTPYTFSDEDAPARCYSALESYMAVQSEYMRIIAREFNHHEMLGFHPDDFDRHGSLTRPWPELSFAFRRPSLPPASSQP